MKRSTGLTGLKVCKNPQHVLSTMYGKILRALGKMPEDAAYRKYTEEIVAHRAAIVAKCCEPFQIQMAIGCGQVEELIVQAENELRLTRNLLHFKPWEPLVQKPEPTQWMWPPTK